MKKRIGSKLYTTDTAECVDRSIGLYRQKNKQAYFICDGQDISPVSYDDAQKMLSKIGVQDVTKHKAGKNGQTKIGVSPAAADRLAAFCRVHGVTQKKVIEDFIYSLEM